MPAVRLADRVVEIIADLGKDAESRYRYGSGCIVRGTTVLTAAHVVAGAAAVTVRDTLKREYTATVDPRFVSDIGLGGPDLALVKVDDGAFQADLAPMRLGVVDRDSPTAEPVERCHAIGYPWFAEAPSPISMRETVDAIGAIPVLSNLADGLLSLVVSIAPRPLPLRQYGLGESEWSGISGAPVVAGGCLLGVISEHAPREGPSTLTVVPLSALEVDPARPGWGAGVKDPDAWWERLGRFGDLQRLPERRSRPVPAYRETLRELGRTLHQRMPQLLGRDRWLAKIAAFATSGGSYRWLLGGAFAGKTALMYEVVTAGLPDEVDVVCYFLSRRASDADSNRFLAAVVPQLAYLCDQDAPASDRDQFRRLWQMAADRATEHGRHLLLVVDGLDEDVQPSGVPSVAQLLPNLENPYAHVLITSRPHPELPVEVPDAHPLRLSRQTAWELEPFEGAAELAELARQEIYDLIKDPAGLEVEILSLLTTAAGPLSIQDLEDILSVDSDRHSPAQLRQMSRLVEEGAARSLELVGPPHQRRYQFAHESLLAYAKQIKDLCHPEYGKRIHRWADRWKDDGWGISSTEAHTPRFLLDTYPMMLAADASRLSALVSDFGWVSAAIATMGVDQTLAILRTAAANARPDSTASAIVALVTAEARNLRPPRPAGQPGYVLRQLTLHAMERSQAQLADAARDRLRACKGADLVPLCTTLRTDATAVELGTHDGSVLAVAAMGDGRVVSGGEDGRVLLWDPATPNIPVELGTHDESVLAVAAMADGRVVSGGEDGRVLLWDPATPNAPVELGTHDESVLAVAPLGDGRVVSGGEDGRVLLWDPATPNAPVELGTHDRWVRAVAPLGDGRVVSGGDDGRERLWDPATPNAPVELGTHDGGVRAVAPLGDGRVVSGGDDWRVLLWDPATPNAPVELGTPDESVLAVAPLGDGRVVSGGEDGRVLLWDPATPNAPVELGIHDGGVRAVTALGDGRVVSGGDDGRVRLWDPANLRAGPVELGIYDGSMLAMAALGDGRVVSGGWDGRVLFWDPANLAAGPVELGSHKEPVWAVAALGDGRVVSGGWDGRVLLWDPANLAAGPVELRTHSRRESTVTALGDGRVVSGGEDGRVLLWNLATPNAPVELGTHLGWVRVASLGDRRVVSGGEDGRVLLWDLADLSRAPVELGTHDGRVQAVAALGDRKVVSGGEDGRLLLWDLANFSGGPVELGTHDGRVRAVTALGDRRVVSGGEDGRVRLWDPANLSGGPVELAGAARAIASVISYIDPASGEERLFIAQEEQGVTICSIHPS